MKSDAKAKPNTPKPVVVTLPKDDAGLTLREYKELTSKDHSTLTASQQKQVAEAQEQLRKMAETVTKHYDFSGFAKVLNAQQAIVKSLAIDTSPVQKMLADFQKTSLSIQPALDAIYKSSMVTQNQFTALAAIQKSMLAFPSESILASIKGIQEAFQAPLIARTMLADFYTMHERIVRNLSFDIGSLTASIEFSRYETVDVAIEKVQTDDKSLTATAVATQTSSGAGITFTDKADLQLILDKLDANQREIADLKQQLLARDSRQGQRLITPSAVSFQRSTSSIQIGSFKVSVSVSSKQAQFARTILTSQENIAKKWDIEDLIEVAFGERIADDEHDWINKIRSYIFQFNQKVMIASVGTMPNYLVLEGIEVFVNPEYLNQ